MSRARICHAPNEGRRFIRQGRRHRDRQRRVDIRRHGAVKKLVAEVAQVTFSGAQALRSGQEVVYVTERAVFRLAPEGVVLTIDLQRDILERMEFAPLMPAEPALMPAAHFTAPV